MPVNMESLYLDLDRVGISPKPLDDLNASSILSNKYLTLL